MWCASIVACVNHNTPPTAVRSTLPMHPSCCHQEVRQRQDIRQPQTRWQVERDGCAPPQQYWFSIQRHHTVRTLPSTAGRDRDGKMCDKVPVH